MLRAGAGSKLDPSLQPGAAGEIATKATTKHALRRRNKGERAEGSALLRGGIISADGAEGKPVQEQLRDALTANAVRVLDLLRERDP